MSAGKIEPKDASGAVLPPPIIFALVLMLGYGLHRMVPIVEVPGPARNYLGIFLIAVAVGLAGLSVCSFWRQKTTVDPYKPVASLVIAGPYRYSRNPMYVAVALLYLGIAAYFSIIWAVIVLPAALVAVHYGVVVREEAHLEGKFGRDYLNYKSRVRRWL